MTVQIGIQVHWSSLFSPDSVGAIFVSLKQQKRLLQIPALSQDGQWWGGGGAMSDNVWFQTLPNLADHLIWLM